MHPFDHVFRRGTEDVLNVRENFGLGGVPANLVFPEGGGVDAKLVGEALADTAVFLPFVAQPLRQRIEVGCLHVMVGSWLELV